MNSDKLSNEQKTEHVEVLKIALQIKLSLKKISGMPKLHGDEKEEFKNQSVLKGEPVKKAATLNEKGQTVTIATGNSMRDGIRKKLVDLLSSADSTNELRKIQATRVALDIEDQVYKVFKDRSKEYSDKIRSIFTNLRDPKNPELKNRLIDREITPIQVATKDATILASRSLQEERERITRLAVESCRTDYENEKSRQNAIPSDMFECSQCKSKKIDVQVISYGTSEDSDKNFLTCMECNLQWMQD